MIILTEKYNNANLIDYASIKSRQVVRSVQGAETFTVADACDAAILIQHNLKSILNKTLQITAFTDSATLLNVMIRNHLTTEKGLMIDIKAAREAYNDKNH